MTGNLFAIWFDFCFFAWGLTPAPVRPTAIIIPFPVKGRRR